MMVDTSRDAHVVDGEIRLALVKVISGREMYANLPEPNRGKRLVFQVVDIEDEA